MHERSDLAVLDLYSISAFSALVLVAAIAFFVVAYQRRMMRQKQIILEQEQNHQSRLLQATTEGQERERARLAQELHDGVGAAMSGVRMGLKQFARKLDPDDDQQKHLDLLRAMLDEGLETVRTVSRDLMPAQLAKAGLVSVLNTLVDRLNASFDGQITFSGNDPGRLAQVVELGLFRSAQELLSNGIRHAEAQEITLLLDFDLESISLDYRDNGKGMDAEQITLGLGLQNLESRVKIMHGTWTLESSPNNGFHYHITVPLQPWK